MKNYHLYIASCREDGGVYHYVCEDGRLAFREKTAMDRPMYLDAAAGSMQVLLRQPFSENKESGLQAWAVGADGSLRRPGPITSTHGLVACHLCRWKGEVYATNYLSGSVCCTNGALDTHQGRGPHSTRQAAAHTHFIAPAPDSACLLSTDLGLDAVYSYDARLRVLGVAHVPAGHGARHLAYAADGKTVFCANELASTVTVFRYAHCQLTPGATVSVLEEPTESTVAAIRVRGEYVYVSNRGDDSISCLRWDGERLALESVTPCGGVSPRDFWIEGDTMWVANEQNDAVTSFRVDGSTLIRRDEPLAIPAPLCIVRLPMED